MAIDRENKPVEKKIFEEETKNGMNIVTIWMAKKELMVN